MTNAQKIKMLIGYCNISLSELARRLNTSPQAFSQRLKTDKFTYQDLQAIAAALGCEWQADFVFPDGTRI